MDQLVKILTPTNDWIKDIDIVDQLYHTVTVYALVVFAALIGLKTYTTGQLDCWFTNITAKHFQDHVNTYCWTHKLYTYPNPFNLSQVPTSISLKHGVPVKSNSLGLDELEEVNFYRWIPVVLLFQAIMFKLPNLYWISSNRYSGIQLDKFVAMIGNNSLQAQQKEKQNEQFDNAAMILDGWLNLNGKDYEQVKTFVCCKKEDRKVKFIRIVINGVILVLKTIFHPILLCLGMGTRLCLLTSYLYTKIWSFVIVILQFFIMKNFLDFHYWAYGFKFFQLFSKTGGEIDYIHFPRLALCHFQVKGEGSWVQCLLLINLMLEKLFVIECSWLYLLLFLTFGNFAAWCCIIVIPYFTVKFVTKFLKQGGTSLEEPEIKRFIDEYLHCKGVFILRIIAANTNDAVMSKLVCSIWKYYKTIPPAKSDSGDMELGSIVNRISDLQDMELEVRSETKRSAAQTGLKSKDRQDQVPV